MQERIAVDPDGPRFESVGDSHGLLSVGGEDSRGESISGVVGELEGFVLSLELSDRNDRAKDLRTSGRCQLRDLTEARPSSSTPHSPPP